MQTTLPSTQNGLRPEPLTVHELGVNPAIVRDLALKTLFYRGRLTRAQLADDMKISVPAVQEITTALARDGLATVLGAETGNASAYVYTLTQQGILRAEEALSRNSYVGPVPVPFEDYVAQVRKQSIADVPIDGRELRRALDALVLREDTMRRIGWAVSSHKPLLIYGESGNGKTTVARTIAHVVGGTIEVPYAIEAVGQIVRVFDGSKHERVPEEAPDDEDVLRARSDRRWVHVRRPMIWAGGELTRHSLELVYDSDTRLYEAPLQLKANGGVLIIDDLGRQQIPAVQLLNRWIVALESASDHLTLHTGQTVEVPFDVILMFSTNLPPEDLADEAFLRRIRYKVEIQGPEQHEFREIFRRECESRGIAYDDAVVTQLLSRWYADGREMRGCHPRDLVEAIVDAAHHDGTQALLTPATLDDACRSYFLGGPATPS